MYGARSAGTSVALWPAHKDSTSPEVESGTFLSGLTSSARLAETVRILTMHALAMSLGMIGISLLGKAVGLPEPMISKYKVAGTGHLQARHAQ